MAENENVNPENQQQQQVEAAQKNPVGRPRLFKSPDEMEIAMERYFLKESQAPTISGLTLALGFNDRDALLKYEGYSEAFRGVIKNAVTRICEVHEKRCLVDGKPVGSIFWLKCHKWREEPQQHEISGKEGGPIKVSVILDAEAVKESGQTNVRAETN